MYIRSHLISRIQGTRESREINGSRILMGLQYIIVFSCISNFQLFNPNKCFLLSMHMIISKHSQFIYETYTNILAIPYQEIQIMITDIMYMYMILIFIQNIGIYIWVAVFFYVSHLHGPIKQGRWVKIKFKKIKKCILMYNQGNMRLHVDLFIKYVSNNVYSDSNHGQPQSMLNILYS